MISREKLNLALISQRSNRNDKLKSYGVKIVKIRISNLVLRTERVRLIFVILDLAGRFMHVCVQPHLAPRLKEE